MKRYYPMYVCGRTKLGSVVYYENMGEINMGKLHEHGVTVPTLLKHYQYQTSFVFEKLAPGPDSKLLTVFDARGISLANLRGDAARFLLAASKENQDGNAHRNAGIVIANAPSWFSSAWSVLAKINAFNADTLKKTQILTEGSQTNLYLQSVIPCVCAR
jgi:hypothetical protein